jgi:hypothetical protein
MTDGKTHQTDEVPEEGVGVDGRLVSIAEAVEPLEAATGIN